MTYDFGARIRSLRTQRNMTQEELGDRLGVSPQAVSKWESGATMPDILLLPELSVLFGVSIDELFSLSDDSRLERIENMLEAVRFLPRQDFEDAERFLKEKMQAEQTRPRATLLLAGLYNKRAAEYHDLARPLAREALLLNPEEKAAHNAIFDAENCQYPDWNARNHWTLIDFYKDFLRVHPENRCAYLWLLDLLLQDGRTAEAREYLSAMDRIGHSFNTPLYAGLIALAEGDHPAALAHWERMTEEFPDTWQAWFTRANSLAMLGRWDEAAEDYRRALELQPSPKYLDAYEAMAQIAEIRGDCEAAIACREKCIELCRSDWKLTDGEWLDCHRREIARLREKMKQ